MGSGLSERVDSFDSRSKFSSFPRVVCGMGMGTADTDADDDDDGSDAEEEEEEAEEMEERKEGGQDRIGIESTSCSWIASLKLTILALSLAPVSMSVCVSVCVSV